jgi:hypothetical protein
MATQKLYWCSICEKIMTKEQTQKISCIDAASKGENPLLSERSRDEQEEGGQMNFIDWHGELFYHHNINFPEELTFMADDPLLVVFASESIINEQFIKFFREKYRLCWKEIYLKLSVILYQTEKCKLCR